MPVPSAAHVLRELEPLLTLLYGSFVKAIPITQTFFSGRGAAPDASLFPHLVRYELKMLLGQAGQISYDEEIFEYERDEISNNGLRLWYARYQLHILKAVDGQLPVPGRSLARRLYYAQQLSHGLAGGHLGGQASSLNLVLLWDVDTSFDLLGLRLSCPKAGSDTRDSVEEYWNEMVPLPGRGVSHEAPEVLEDLPIDVGDEAAASDESAASEGS